jgi:UDP-N-acetylmuramoyl-L-alanyl-D-glutamate--2,6-diaminopimelate ligase
MNLRKLFKNISGISNDSRKVKQGFAFLAYPGAKVDGRDYIDSALSAGAALIIYDPAGREFIGEKFFAIENLASQLAVIASEFYHHPTKDLYLTGITGTNGKTSIAYQLSYAQDACYIGTLGYGKISKLNPSQNTTPDALVLQQLLSQLVSEGIKHVNMEVSSHALAQHRVDKIKFRQAIFTNLSHDHLDYHKTLENYVAAKALLFSMPDLEIAIINGDDAYAKYMLDAAKSVPKVFTYGFNPGLDYQVLSYDIRAVSTQVALKTPTGMCNFTLNSVTKFSIYNSLAVFISLIHAGFSMEQVLVLMPNLPAVPGRMQIVHQKPCVIVDYAHTPDALANVLAALKKLKQAKLWVVFGCGGDRDTSKRKVMGEVASQYADEIILTSDNPRSEDPALILAAVAEGVSKDYKILPDRKQAIFYALAQAGPQDLVLIAGKGHEDYQEIQGLRQHFSDREVVLEFYSSEL